MKGRIKSILLNVKFGNFTRRKFTGDHEMIVFREIYLHRR